MVMVGVGVGVGVGDGTASRTRVLDFFLDFNEVMIFLLYGFFSRQNITKNFTNICVTVYTL